MQKLDNTTAPKLQAQQAQSSANSDGLRAPLSGTEHGALSSAQPAAASVPACGGVKRRRHFDHDRWLALKAAEFEALKASCAAHTTLPDDDSPVYVTRYGIRYLIEASKRLAVRS